VKKWQIEKVEEWTSEKVEGFSHSFGGRGLCYIKTPILLKVNSMPDPTFSRIFPFPQPSPSEAKFEEIKEEVDYWEVLRQKLLPKSQNASKTSSDFGPNEKVNSRIGRMIS
jgi:hypothetical protein